MKPSSYLIIPFFLLVFYSHLYAVVGDRDNDGLRDEVETNTGIYVSPFNTGTNPDNPDTDGDSVPDGLEISLGTDPTNAASKTTRPNIILINCDDLGYGDIGCFWQNQKVGNKFATPGIDAMAAEGMMMTHHYVGAPICAASRASLLQGRHQGHADIRDKQFDKALPNNHSIASVLKSGGYRTIHIGKAGLAGTGVTNLPGHPLLRGFDRFFGYYSHYHAQEHYPQNGNNSRGAAIYDDYSRITDAYVDLYTTDVWTAFAKKTIKEETTTHPNRPFFMYLAYDAPHFDNEIPPTKDYPIGKGLTGGIQWTGSPSYVNTATNDIAKINNLSNQHSSINPAWPQYAKEHVSMIRRIDDSVADLLQTLRDLGIDKNTLVVFTSDNGPDYFRIDPTFFQGFANFEGTKTDIWEGGIRVPTIAWWPGHISATKQLSNIRTSARPSGNWDWLATFAEIASIPAPSYTDGISMAPTLTGNGTQHEKGYQYFEFNSPGGATVASFGFVNHSWDKQEQSQAIRIGDFMGVRNNVLNETDNFRIYNVTSDTHEGINLASSRPDLQARMKYLAISARRPNADAPRPYDTARIPAATPNPVTNGLKYQCYEGYWPYLPEFRDMTPKSSGLTANITPAVRSRNNDAGISFTGYISVPTTGSYTFSLNSNSMTNLWIHDGHVIDNDFNFTLNKSSEPVYLEAGLHPLRLYYAHQSGTPILSLSYAGPGFPMQAVPENALFTEGPTPIFNLQADSVITKINTPILITPLANDTANYPMTLSSIGSANSGIASITGGQILFSPVNGFLGSVTFPYSVSGGAKTATSTITADILFDNETWIPMNEGTGRTVRSVSMTALNTGTLSTTTNPEKSWTLGKSGSCLSFDGVDDKVEFPNLVVPMGSSPRTITCWIRTSATELNENQTILSYGGDITGQGFSIRLGNISGSSTPNRVRVVISGASIIGTRPVNDGLWHHIAVVIADRNSDGLLNIDETIIYVDGIADLITEVTPKSIFTTAGFPPTIGGSSQVAHQNFKGDLDEVRIFPRALASNELASLRGSTAILAPTDGDSDGDGVSDINEIIAGTNPIDANSFFRIKSSTILSQSIVLKWSAVAGKSYSAEESDDLKTWNPVAGVLPLVPSADIPEASLSIPRLNSSHRFLRMSVQ